MMKEKLQACLKIYDNREFRTLYDRFNSYFKAAEELEEVIEVVIKSRDKINRLFKDL